MDDGAALIAQGLAEARIAHLTEANARLRTECEQLRARVVELERLPPAAADPDLRAILKRVERLRRRLAGRHQADSTSQGRSARGPLP